MAEWQLQAESAFGEQSPLTMEAGGVTLREVAAATLVSFAFDAAKKPSEFPAVGESARLQNDAVLLGMQVDQVWLFGASASAGEWCRDGVYLSDQSDSWAILQLEDQADGERVRQMLERLCPLDLHPDGFPVGRVARTQMEHLAVIIWREASNHYLLMSPRSSAGSFLHALQTALPSG